MIADDYLTLKDILKEREKQDNTFENDKDGHTEKIDIEFVLENYIGLVWERVLFISLSSCVLANLT